MALVIPEKYHASMQLLSGLDLNAVNTLANGLAECPPTFSIIKLVDHLRKSEKEIQLNEEQLEAIIALLVNLYYLWSASFDHYSIDEFVNEVVSAADSELSEINKDSLEQNLLGLLQLDGSVGVTAKALDLMTDYERVMRDVRIITDSRPVFTVDGRDAPVAFMTNHTLKIEYMKDQELGYFYVAMDSNDIARLHRLLDRALRKESNLEAFVSKSDAQYLDSGLLEE